MKKIQTFGLALVVVVVALAVCLVAPCEGGQVVWKVEKQTEAQKQAYETLKEKAKQDSESATPGTRRRTHALLFSPILSLSLLLLTESDGVALLAYFDSPEFRSNISTLPDEIKVGLSSLFCVFRSMHLIRSTRHRV